MGRLSQLFWFFDEEKMPTEAELKHNYSHLSITPEIKRLRRKIRRERKEVLNGHTRNHCSL